MSSLVGTYALLLSILLWASAGHGQALVPLPFTLAGGQTLQFSHNGCGVTGPIQGGNEVSLPSSSNCSLFGNSTINAVVSSSLVDGRLVLTLSGTGSSSCQGGCEPLQTYGGLAALTTSVRVNVPLAGSSAAAAPPTLVIWRITKTPKSAGLAYSGAQVGFGSSGTSRIAGENHSISDQGSAASVDESDGYSILQGGGQLSLIGGDVFTLPVLVTFGAGALLSGGPVTFNESATLEMMYIPEPSGSSMLPSGVALLAMLAHYRAR